MNRWKTHFLINYVGNGIQNTVLWSGAHEFVNGGLTNYRKNFPKYHKFPILGQKRAINGHFESKSSKILAYYMHNGPTRTK